MLGAGGLLGSAWMTGARPWTGSPRLVAAAVTHPLSINPVIAAAGLLPAGRGRMSSLIRMVAARRPGPRTSRRRAATS